MTPERDALLRNIARAAQSLDAAITDPEWKSLLAVISTCTQELAQREDDRFYLAFLDQGRDLLARGERLLAQHGRGMPDVPAIPGARRRSAGLPFEDDIADLLARMTATVHGLHGTGDAAIEAYLRSATDWEMTLYNHRLEPVPQLQGAEATASSAEQFEAYLQRRLADRSNVRLSSFRPLPGGFSKSTILAAMESDEHGREDVVLRVEPPLKFFELDGHDLANEYSAIRAVYSYGLPVPEPLWFEEDRGVLGGRFMVSRRARGSSYGSPTTVDRGISDGIVRSIARTLAQIHAARADPDDPLIANSHLAYWVKARSLPEATRMWVEYYRDQIRRNDLAPSPLMTRGFDWLLDNVPREDGPLALLHGDFGIHNILIEGDEVTAAVDWENVRIGDPAEEIASVFVVASSYIDRDRFMAHYYAAGGAPISEYRIAYFLVFNAVYGTLGGHATLRRMQLPEANVKWGVFGLKHMQHYATHLETAIANAEKVRDAIPA